MGDVPLPRGTPWVSPRSTDELVNCFSDFSVDIRALLSCIREPSAWAIHAVHPPRDAFVRRRVALLGDAAHAMPPHLGAGAGQAIEDARALVRLLTNRGVGRHNIEVSSVIFEFLTVVLNSFCLKPRAFALIGSACSLRCTSPRTRQFGS